MSKEIKTEIHINASPAKVWAIFSDFKSYPQWNPFIKSLTGEVKVGGRIVARIQPPDSSVMTFKPTILTYEEGKELSWLGKLFISGLFDGLHKFEIIKNTNDSTTFKHSEVFKGLLTGILNMENTKKGFEAMNLKLKSLTESGS